MDNSLVAHQIVEEALSARGNRTKAVEIVKGYLDNMEKLYHPESTTPVVASSPSLAKFLEAHKPFFLRFLRDFGRRSENGYVMTLRYSPTDDGLAVVS